MSPSLKKQAVHGAFWSFMERFGQQGIQFVIAIILARLLEPKDFGILAMIMVFNEVARTIVASGFGVALIQKKEIDQKDKSTAFWVNVVSGFLMAGTMCLLAPWVAAFYDVPLLAPVMRVFSLNMMIISLSIVQNSLLQKEMLFNKRAVAVFSGCIASGVAGVGMALGGFGVWALVASSLVSNAVRTLSLWMVHSWRPSLQFSKSSFQSLFGFGSKMLVSGILTTLFRNIYLIVIGKLFSAVELGFYQIAKRVSVMSIQTLSQVVGQVNLPLMARMQEDPNRMRQALTKVMRATMLVILPMALGLAMVSSNFAEGVLGEKWIPAVPYLQVSCLIGVFFPIHLLNINVITARGRSDIHLGLEVAKKVLTVISITITYRYGVMAMLWGQFVCSAISLVLNSFYLYRTLGFGIFRQMAAIWKTIAASGVMVAAIWCTDALVQFPPIGMLALKIVVGGAVFVLVEWMLKDSAFIEVSPMVVARLNWKRSEVKKGI